MTKFELFLDKMSGETVDIIGVGVSNSPLIKLLANNGAKVRAFDQNVNIELSEFDGLDIEFVLGGDYLEKLDGKYIFRTPGMHPLEPQLVKAEKNGSIITSEMEIFFEVCPCKMIAITGSDGKTTTTTLIYEILKNQGYNCHLGGNIGAPLLCDTPSIKPDDICVVELSSFQLQTMNIAPGVAVITNITPNHLDKHTDMDEYVMSKMNVFGGQKCGQILVVNADDELTKDCKSGGTTLNFSMRKNNLQGVFLDGDEIIINHGVERKSVMKISDIALPGMHNVQNYMTAICATYHLVDSSEIVNVARSFRGVPHRIEFVREIDGVKYYNDSIATSPTRAIAGLVSFDEKVILIAGGYDKKIPFEPLAPIISKQVKNLVLIGDTSHKIHDAVREIDKEISITICDEFEQAILTAKSFAKPDDVVILSPACAAFDRFKNFAVRGDMFKKIVNDWR